MDRNDTVCRRLATPTCTSSFFALRSATSPCSVKDGERMANVLALIALMRSFRARHTTLFDAGSPSSTPRRTRRGSSLSRRTTPPFNKIGHGQEDE